MEADEFRVWWQAEFGVCPPLGHRLRIAFPRRWMRFHSMPDGKRYAETPDEEAEVLHRHNVIASALLGHGEPIVIVCTAYSFSGKPVPPDDRLAAQTWLHFVHTDTVAIDDDGVEDGPPGYWHFWAAPTTWLPGRFDELLIGVARDDIKDILLVQPDRRAVYHPYDGGADVIGADVFVCDSMRRDFRHWLSTHPSGL